MTVLPVIPIFYVPFFLFRAKKKKVSRPQLQEGETGHFWRIVPTYALKLSQNACVWPELVDLKFARVVTERVVTDNIAMWAIRHSIVDWVRSKTQTLAGDFENSRSTFREIL